MVMKEYEKMVEKNLNEIFYNFETISIKEVIKQKEKILKKIKKELTEKDFKEEYYKENQIIYTKINGVIIDHNYI